MKKSKSAQDITNNFSHQSIDYSRDDTLPDWVVTQRKTFTAWCNQFLEARGMRMSDLRNDFKDGVMLVNLLEEISDKSIRGYTKKPKMRAQYMENCSKAVNFVKSQGITIVNLGPEDFVDGELKLIIGFIWTLILRYQINRGRGTEGFSKWVLISWVQKKVKRYGLEPKNLTTDFADGKVMYALTDSLDPGKLDYKTLKGSPIDVTKKACEFAKQEFKIPIIMDPVDIVEHPDELSMITYLSYFQQYADEHPTFVVEEEEEKIPVDEPEELDDIVYDMEFTTARFKFKTAGKGLHDSVIGNPGEFYLKVLDKNSEKAIDISAQKIHLKIEAPGVSIPEIKVKRVAKGKYFITYMPVKEGRYILGLGVEDQSVFDGRLVKWVSPTLGSTPIVEGLTKTHPFDQPFSFTVWIKNQDGSKEWIADKVPFDITLKGPSDQTLPIKIVPKPEDKTWVITAKPKDKGVHSFAVNYYSKPISGSPFKVDFQEKIVETLSLASLNEESISFDLILDTTKYNLKVGGPGLKKGSIGSPGKIYLQCTDKKNDLPVSLSLDKIKVTFKGPHKVPDATITSTKPGNYVISYSPVAPGSYKASLSIENEKTETDPISWILPTLDSEVETEEFFTFDLQFLGQKYNLVVGGPGLVSGQLGRVGTIYLKVLKRNNTPADIPVNSILAKIEPKVEKVTILRSGPGAFVIRYLPKKVGEYTITLTADEESTEQKKVKWTLPGDLIVGISQEEIESTLKFPIEKESLWFDLEYPNANYRVLAGGRGLKAGQLGRASPVNLRVLEKGSNKPANISEENIVLNVSGPSPVKQSRILNTEPGVYVARYLPEEKGIYKISVDINQELAFEEEDVQWLDVGLLDAIIPEESLEENITFDNGQYKLMLGGNGVKKGRLDRVGRINAVILDSKTEEHVEIEQKRIIFKATGPEAVPPPQIIPSPLPGVFAIRYLPVRAGVYSLSLLLDNKPLCEDFSVPWTDAPGFPISLGAPNDSGLEAPISEEEFVCDLPFDTNKYKVLVGGLGSKGGILGRASPICLRVLDKVTETSVQIPPEKIKLTVSGPGKVKQSKVKKADTPGEYLVRYIPDTEGQYKISLDIEKDKVINDLAVKWINSGLDDAIEEFEEENLELPVKTNKYKLVFGGNGLKSGRLDEVGRIFLKVFDKKTEKPIHNLSPSSISLLTSGPAEVPLPKVLKSSSPGGFIIRYLPIKEGSYKLSLSVDKEEAFKNREVKWNLVEQEESENLRRPKKNLSFNTHAMNTGLDKPVESEEEMTFNLTLPQIHPNYHILAGGRGLQFGTLGRVSPVYLKVQTKQREPVDIDIERIKVQIFGPGNVEPAKILKSGLGSYSIRYLPTVEGDYQVSLSIEDDDAIPSKLVHWRPPGTAADPTKCEIVGLGKFPVGKICRFKIISKTKDGKKKNTGGDPFEVIINDSSNSPVPVRLDDSNDGEYHVEFQPKKVGPADISVRLGPLPVQQSPFKIEFTPREPADPLMSTVRGWEGKFPLSQPVKLLIIAKSPSGVKKNDGGDPFVLDVISENTGISFPLSVVDRDNGEYEVTFTPNLPGSATLSVLLNKKHITGSPFKTDIFSPEGDSLPDPDKLTFTEEYKSAKYKILLGGPGVKGGTVGKESPIYLKALNSNNGPLNLRNISLVLRGPSFTPQPTVKSFGEHHPGLYCITYSPPAPGAYNGLLAADGHNIVKDLQLIWTKDGGSEDISKKTTPSKQSYTDKPTFEIVNASEAPLSSLAPISDDDLEEPSEYPFSSFTSNYKCLAAGEGLKQGTIGSPGIIFLKVLDKHSKKPVNLPIEQISLDVKGSAVVPPASIKPYKSVPGTYLIKYSPTRPAKYDLFLMVDKRDILRGKFAQWVGSPRLSEKPQSSPRQSPISPRINSNNQEPNPAKTEIIGLKNKYPLGSPIKLKILPKDKDGKPVKKDGLNFFVVALGKDNDIPASVNNLGNGEYIVTITPNEVGPIDIDITLNSEPIGDSPFSGAEVVKDLPDFEALNYDIVGFNSDITDTDSPKVTLVTKNKNGDLLKKAGLPMKATIKSNDGKEDLSPTVEDNKDGTYTISWNNDNLPLGNYNLDVKVDNAPIKGFPKQFKLRKGSYPEKSELEFEPVTRCAIKVRTFDKKGKPRTNGGEKLKVNITGSNGVVSEKEVVDNKDGTYTVVYEGTPGEYRVSVEMKVTNDWKHIKGSPFAYVIQKIEMKQIN